MQTQLKPILFFFFYFKLSLILCTWHFSSYLYLSYSASNWQLFCLQHTRLFPAQHVSSLDTISLSERTFSLAYSPYLSQHPWKCHLLGLFSKWFVRYEHLIHFSRLSLPPPIHLLIFLPQAHFYTSPVLSSCLWIPSHPTAIKQANRHSHTQFWTWCLPHSTQELTGIILVVHLIFLTNRSIKHYFL